MPKNVLPEAARVLPKAGQAVWLKAFNEALDEGISEEEASMVAWAAVKRAGYSKNSNGKWSKSMDENSLIINDDNTFSVGAPLMKVNVQKRIIEGFATLNNVDQARDRVEADASIEAFGNWFGNIREMHQKKAVGKAVDWRPETYTDEKGNTYEGIWVSARISKGAEDTWQKVLDGTLAGFSIGGVTQEKERTFAKDEEGVDRQIWAITKYKLTELSLVDNPCNRLSTISLIKSIDGQIEVDDTIADGDMSKAWDGEKREFVDLSSGYQSAIEGLERLRDEAIESNADNVVSRVSEILHSLRNEKAYEVTEAEYYNNQVYKSEEANMSKEEVENEMEKSEEDLQENEVSDISIVELSEEEKSIFRKLIDFIKGEETPASVSDGGVPNNIEKGEDMKEEDVTKAIDSVKEDLTKSVDEKFVQVGESLEKIAGLLEKVATAEAVEEVQKGLDAKIDELAARIEVVEKSGGVKKSGDDAGDAGEKIEKSDDGFWGDSILPSFLTDQR